MHLTVALLTTLLAQAPDGRGLAVTAHEVEELPRIDGVLSEPIWQSAATLVPPRS